MSAPQVSVCIPAYNHGRFVGAAVTSALEQTFDDLEVVVSDNRSSDETAEVIKVLAASDPRVRYELASAHIGMAENFNRCISLARGRYVKFLCADDLLEPQCVERLVAELESQQAILSCCARYRIGEHAELLGTMRFSRSRWSGSGLDAARRCFYYGNLIGEPTAVLMRRADIGDGFRPSYTQLIDLDLWLRMLERGRLAFLPEPLCRVRTHAGQASEASAASGKISADKRQLFRDYASRPHMRGSLWQKVLWDFRVAWSMQREPASRRGAPAPAPLFYPGAWPAMRAGAALARRLRMAA